MTIEGQLAPCPDAQNNTRTPEAATTSQKQRQAHSYVKKGIEQHVEADDTSISYDVLRYQMVQHGNLEHKPKVDCFN